jgi:hypothetical protein
MKYVLFSLLSLVLSSISAAQQTSATVRIVPIGQLDGPRLRQLAPVPCGPYFTIAPTDPDGGGIVHFGIRRSEELDDDPTDDIEVVGFSSGIIRVRLCAKCDAPKAERQADGDSEWINLSISPRDLKLSPCLRKARVVTLDSSVTAGQG